jgi:hypothetical protein|tara:strand:+ start:65 stop:319 length:255 start_codon:yes stop_codon:yes gene_type:complete
MDYENIRQSIEAVLERFERDQINLASMSARQKIAKEVVAMIREGEINKKTCVNARHVVYNKDVREEGRQTPSEREAQQPRRRLR